MFVGARGVSAEAVLFVKVKAIPYRDNCVVSTGPLKVGGRGL